jgi:gluconolactonase
VITDVTPVAGIAERFPGLLEGPRRAPDGRLVFSDVLAGGVYAAGPDGVTEILPKRRGIGGVVPHADGGWIVSGRGVVHVAPDGAQRELWSPGDDAVGVNDMGTTPAGDLLIGVLRYHPLAGDEPRPGALVKLPAGGGAPVTLTEDVTWPNGIGISPDAATIYLSDYAAKAVLAVPAAGGAARTFAQSPRGSADGLAVDAHGGVWIALGEGAGVARFTPDGALDQIVDLPAAFVSSLSFAGHDVLITGIAALLTARTAVPGAPVAPARV